MFCIVRFTISLAFWWLKTFIISSFRLTMPFFSSLLCDILLDFFFSFCFLSALHVNVKRTCVWLQKMRNYEPCSVRLLACLFACLCSIQEMKSAKPTHNYCMHAGMEWCRCVVLCCKFYNSKTKIQPRKCKRKRKKNQRKRKPRRNGCWGEENKSMIFQSGSFV